MKVKYDDFQQITRSRSCADPIGDQGTIERVSLDLLRPLFPPPRGIRLLGVTISNFDQVSEPSLRQLALTLAGGLAPMPKLLGFGLGTGGE